VSDKIADNTFFFTFFPPYNPLIVHKKVDLSGFLFPDKSILVVQNKHLYEAILILFVGF
jgi:hypothetical protein